MGAHCDEHILPTVVPCRTISRTAISPRYFFSSFSIHPQRCFGLTFNTSM